jgi:hypothetical protein
VRREEDRSIAAIIPGAEKLSLAVDRNACAWQTFPAMAIECISLPYDDRQTTIPHRREPECRDAVGPPVLSTRPVMLTTICALVAFWSRLSSWRTAVNVPLRTASIRSGLAGGLAGEVEQAAWSYLSQRNPLLLGGGPGFPMAYWVEGANRERYERR